MSKFALDLYQKYFEGRQFERLDLFEIIADKFNVQRALYPGSFVHITPSFVFPDVVYVDNDKQAKQFFGKPEIFKFIAERKVYAQEAKVSFYFTDYRNSFEEPLEAFDLLISQYAGFISQHCKRYLKIKGILLVNDSHGDASMAFIDPDYEFIGAILRNKGKHRISENGLETYFIPKKPVEVSKEYLEQIQKSIAYQKTASSYLFRRVK